MPSSNAELEGNECSECGSKDVVQVVQGRFRKYGYCTEHANPSFPNDVRVPRREPPIFELIAKEGRVPEPFKTAFISAKTKKEAEEKFRQEHSTKEAQIDEIQINKFCAMIIYHDPKIPTV